MLAIDRGKRQNAISSGFCFQVSGSQSFLSGERRAKFWQLSLCSWQIATLDRQPIVLESSVFDKIEEDNSTIEIERLRHLADRIIVWQTYISYLKATLNWLDLSVFFRYHGRCEAQNSVVEINYQSKTR